MWEEMIDVTKGERRRMHKKVEWKMWYNNKIIEEGTKNEGRCWVGESQKVMRG